MKAEMTKNEIIYNDCLVPTKAKNFSAIKTQSSTDLFQTINRITNNLFVKVDNNSAHH